MTRAEMRALIATSVAGFLTLACTRSNAKEGSFVPIGMITIDPKDSHPPIVATATPEMVATLIPPTPTRIAIATPTLRPLEAVPSAYAVATRALDDDRDLIDAKNNVIATLNGNRNLISFMENGPLTETQLKALMEKNSIGLAFKKGIKDNSDKLFKMEKGELKEIPVPQLTPRLTPDDFWSDQDNPENPHGLMTEKAGTKTHVVFDGKNWVEYVDGKSTGRVVFDMQKENAAVGGPIPGAKENVVTVTPKPPLTEAPPKPIFGDEKLDKALAAMQTNPREWNGWMTTSNSGGREGMVVKVIGIETPVSPLTGLPSDTRKDLIVSGVNGEKLRGWATSVNGLDIYSVNINGNTVTGDLSGKKIDNSRIAELVGKNVVVIGPSLIGLRDYGSRHQTIGLGVLTSTP